MPSAREAEADLLARDLYEARRQLQEAGRALHDQPGPLLSAAGIHLQLLRMDQPGTAATVEEILQLLDQVTDGIRALSQKLDASPASHIGLERALARLAEEHGPGVTISYGAASKLPAAAAVAIYDIIVNALGRAVGKPVRISVRGSGQRLAVRMQWKGRVRWPRGEVNALARRLRPAGVLLDLATKESTIVSILYATRRSARR
ncbi:MAG TPA: hypothetical protein VGN17_00560 [Bryobacteraceae bacterium]|jgi:hypothetical protein